MFGMYLTELRQRWLMTALTLCWSVFLINWAFSLSPELSLQPYDTEGCAVASSKASSSLLVFGPAIVLEPLLPVLCNSAFLAKHFKQVNLTWHAHQQLQPDDLTDGRYQLIWSRPEFLRGVLHNFETYYQEVWTYPNYPVYWISSTAVVDATAAFFKTQRIGLLADVSSYSGYQLPVAALQQLGLDLRQTEHKFYADRLSLSMAAKNGEITLYPGVLFSANGNVAAEAEQSELYDAEGVLVPAEHRVQMPGLSNGGSFYLHKKLQPLRCELRQLIAGSMLPLASAPSNSSC